MSDSPAPSATSGKRPYYRPTTVDQRKLLFRTYEQTNSPRKASQVAHVGIGTFYKWRKRFEQGGYPALEAVRSHAAHHHPNQLPESVIEEVIQARREHPEWGRHRIADELAKAHDWQQVVSASEVRRILVKAGLWSEVAQPPKGQGRSSATPKRPTRR